MKARIREITPNLKYRVVRTVLVVASSFRKMMGSDRNAANNGNKEILGLCINNKMAIRTRNHLLFVPENSLKNEKT
jgi:hypothetical protein